MSENRSDERRSLITWPQIVVICGVLSVSSALTLAVLISTMVPLVIDQTMARVDARLSLHESLPHDISRKEFEFVQQGIERSKEVVVQQITRVERKLDQVIEGIVVRRMQEAKDEDAADPVEDSGDPVEKGIREAKEAKDE